MTRQVDGLPTLLNEPTTDMGSKMAEVQQLMRHMNELKERAERCASPALSAPASLRTGRAGDISDTCPCTARRRHQQEREGGAILGDVPPDEAASCRVRDANAGTAARATANGLALGALDAFAPQPSDEG